MNRPIVASWAAALLLGVLVLPPALASDHADHDRARAALQAGEIRPLAEVLLRVAAQHPGQVLAVELEREAGRWIYEIKLLQDGGGLLRLEVDAATAQVLKARARQPGSR